MSLPVSQSWDATLDFVKRESHLLVPLALGTLAVGQAAVELGIQLHQRHVGMAALLVLIIPGILLMLGGQLSIFSLVLNPGISVGEALKKGFSRLPRLMAFSLGMGALFVALIFPVMIILLKNGYDPAAAKPVELPSYAVIWAGAVMTIMLWASVRTYFAAALMVDADASVRSAVFGSFSLTRGRAAMLLGVAMIFLVVGTVIQSAAEVIVGIFFGALGKLLAMPLLPVVMVALGVGMAAAAVGLVTAVFVAMLYRSISS
jgi:hypothetical protein